MGRLAVLACLVSLVIALAPVPAGAQVVAAPAGSVGAVGCSNTSQSVDGYDFVGGAAFWPAKEVKNAAGGIGRGSMDRWADLSSQYWDYLETMFARYPDTTAVWWQICLVLVLRPGDSPTPSAEEIATARLIYDEIQRRKPGVQVYVSGLNGYDGITCEALGANGAVAAAALAQELADTTNASLGPTMTPLNATNHRGDQCHGGESAVEAWGHDLMAFFGTGTGAAPEETAPPAPGDSPPTGRDNGPTTTAAGEPTTETTAEAPDDTEATSSTRPLRETGTRQRPDTDEPVDTSTTNPPTTVAGGNLVAAPSTIEPAEPWTATSVASLILLTAAGAAYLMLRRRRTDTPTSSEGEPEG